MQAVLDQGWLQAHKAVISYVDKCVMYFSGNGRRRLCFRPDAPDLPALVPSPKLLSRLQLKSMCKDKGNKLFLVHVSAADEPDEKEEGEISVASKSTALPQVAEPIVSKHADVFADTPPGLPLGLLTSIVKVACLV